MIIYVHVYIYMHMQWLISPRFGNLVTMEWWEQLWLNEGFANWMQTHAVNMLFPEWHIWEQPLAR